MEGLVLDLAHVQVKTCWKLCKEGLGKVIGRSQILFQISNERNPYSPIWKRDRAGPNSTCRIPLRSKAFPYLEFCISFLLNLDFLLRIWKISLSNLEKYFQLATSFDLDMCKFPLIRPSLYRNMRKFPMFRNFLFHNFLKMGRKYTQNDQ